MGEQRRNSEDIGQVGMEGRGVSEVKPSLLKVPHVHHCKYEGVFAHHLWVFQKNSFACFALDNPSVLFRTPKIQNRSNIPDVE